MRRSFDIIGDIAVIEASTKKEERELIRKVTSTYPRIKCVLKKESAVRGVHRTTKFKIVYKNAILIKASNVKTTETIHKENGCQFFLDVRKVFFNPRESTIRRTLAEMVQPGEHVLVMFSGIAPYPIQIARRVDCRVTAIERNKAAVAYAEENIRKNKVADKVTLYTGNVRQATGTYDRIIMPLGTDGWKYLSTAFSVSKKGTIIHCYGISHTESSYQDIEEIVEKEAKKAGVKVSIVGKRIILPFAPRIDKVCLDIKVM